MNISKFIAAIELDRIEVYFWLGVACVFIGAASFSLGLAFLLCGFILILMAVSAITTARARTKGN